MQDVHIVVKLNQDLYKQLLKSEEELQMSRHDIINVCLRRYLDDKATKVLIENKKKERQKQMEENQEEKQEELHEFQFLALDAPRKWHPYAARLTIKDDKIQREFYEFKRDYKGNKVSVYGTFKAPVGAVIEQRHGNENKYWYVVTSTGCLIPFTPSYHEEGRKDIISYLKGEINLKQLEEKIDNHLKEMFEGGDDE